MSSSILRCRKASISGSHIWMAKLPFFCSFSSKRRLAYFLQASWIVQAAICCFHSNSPASSLFRLTASLAFFRRPFVLNLKLQTFKSKCVAVENCYMVRTYRTSIATAHMFSRQGTFYLSQIAICLSLALRPCKIKKPLYKKTKNLL